MLWSYTALGKDGQILKDSREAESRFALMQETKAEGLTLIAVHEEESDAGTPNKGWQAGWISVQAKVVTLFTRQLADLCDAGVPLTESLRTLSSLESSKRFSEILDQIFTKILQGQSFSEALGGFPDVFSRIYINMVKVGESTGRLAEVLNGLASLRERDEELKGRLKSALFYPLFTLGFSLFLVWILVAYVLPGFIPIWTGSGLDLHRYPITEFLLQLSHLTGSVLDEILLAACLFGIFLFYRSMMKAPEAQHARDALILKIPAVGSFVQMGVVARVCNTLGLMVKSGVGLVPSINLSAQTIENSVYREALVQVSKDIQEGNSFSAALKNQKDFPPMMTQMVGIGEQSGNLDDMFLRMADYYDRQLEGSLKTIVSLMEPLTMVFVGGIVFVFVLGVFLPIMGIVQALQSQM